MKGYLAVMDDGLLVLVNDQGEPLGRVRSIVATGDAPHGLGLQDVALHVTDIGPMEPRPCPACAKRRLAADEVILVSGQGTISLRTGTAHCAGTTWNWDRSDG